MPTYRILTLGPHRKIQSAKDIECASEEGAIAQVEQLVDGHDIELWERVAGSSSSSNQNRPGGHECMRTIECNPIQMT